MFSQKFLKPTVRIDLKQGIARQLNAQGAPVTFQPWLADRFSFLYDTIMQRSVFPKKFGADIHLHREIIADTLAGVRLQRVIEVGTGGGITAGLLPSSNDYVGSDISAGLLKRAVHQFQRYHFSRADFYLNSAEKLPFQDNIFDCCLCLLTLNFCEDTTEVIKELKRVLKTGGRLLCCVPVPERNARQSKIRGVLHSEKKLKQLFEMQGFSFTALPKNNGALLYFQAEVKV